MITSEQLLSICGRCPDPGSWASILWLAMEKGNITTVTRAAAFLGQCAHESGEFRYMEELASGQLYEGREDLGNTQPGDGPRFKGRGIIQLTGRDNYRHYGFEDCPDKAAEPCNAAAIAVQYWVEHGCNELADNCQYVLITRKINGGLNGLEPRLWYYRRALEVLGVSASLKEI